MGWITFNRPERFNALDISLGEELVKVLEICAKSPDMRARNDDRFRESLLFGWGRQIFQRIFENRSKRTLRQVTKLLNRIIMDIRLVPKPVLAAINGVASGAGIIIALSCDLRIASASVKFKQAYTGIGLVPDGAWTIWVSLVAGYEKASEMIFLDPVYDSNKALEIGLVNQVVPPENLLDAAMEWAQKLANGPTLAFARSKDELNHAMLSLLERQLEVERQNMIKAAQTEDYPVESTKKSPPRKPLEQLVSFEVYGK